MKSAPLSPRWAFLRIFLVALGAAASLYQSLASDVYLRGTDAYYYALQAKYWAKTGAAVIPDGSWIHPIVGELIRWGLGPETALRVWIAATLALCFLCFHTLTLKNPGRLSAWLLGIWLLFSPTILFVAIEFPRMFLFLTLLPLWFWPTRRAWLLAVLIAFLSLGLHRAALPLAVLFALAQIIPNLAPFSKRKIAAGAVVFLLFTLLAAKLFHLDLQRLAFSELRPGLLSLLSRENLPLAIRCELVAGLSLFVATGIYLWKKSPASRHDFLTVAALCLPALIPLGGREVFGVGERYAILLPYLSMLGLARLRLYFPRDTWIPLFSWGAPHLIMILLLFITSSFRLEKSHPLSIDPDYPSYAAVSSALGAQDIPMLIAHKGLAYYYKYQWMREAFPYEPEPHWNKARVWRVLYKIFPEELNYYLDESCGWESGRLKSMPSPDYVLIREDCWEAMRLNFTEMENSDLYERSWRTPLNPAQRRPAFLYERHANDAKSEFPALAP